MILLTWAVMLYLAGDFSDPSMPGAFTFNAEESIEVVHLHKVPVPDPPGPATPPSPAAPRAFDPSRRDQSVFFVQLLTVHPALTRRPTARRDLHQRAAEPAPSEEG